ncbi:MAG TPA: DinB family protein [Flavitalea sp.]|nr:DinB family protein [Flavitalea sp.]
MKKILFIIFLCVLVIPCKLYAQDATAQMVKEWERARKFTQDYLEAMPEDGYAFKPTKEMRSFAQQMLHLAAANFGLGSMALGITSPVKYEEVENATDQSKAATEKIVLESYDYVITGLKGLNADKLNENVTVFNNTLPRQVALQKTFEHQTHHRGQTTVYLRLKGVTPPAEKLF